VPFRLDDALAALRPHAIRQAADGDKHAWEYLLRDLIQGRAIDPIRLDDALATLRPHAIRQAADGDKHALEYLLRDFIQGAKQGRVIDPKVARLVADVLERVLAGGDIEEILGTPKSNAGVRISSGKRFWFTPWCGVISRSEVRFLSPAPRKSMY
jgi:hypothetical protein